MLLCEQVVIVSGIGPGLGQELALAAAREGAHLVVSARTPARLAAVAEDIAALGLGTRVLEVPTDIRDRAACEKLVEATVGVYGRIDVLINSAYVTGIYAPAATADLGDWRETMETNLFGTMTMIQSVVPQMTAQDRGSIVNVNTKIARMPQETLGGYAVSKAALRMATTQLAKELGAAGIRVNSVFPGWMWGETVESGLRAAAESDGVTIDELRAEIAQRIPLGEIPEDAVCAKAVVAFASDHFEAVTGACLDISGGEYMPL
jgi:NAD(P)-dependent dehydrogenase (short-subunit alcohol dehydrogenase family)